VSETLYARMRTHGTLTETPEEIPDAVFALPSTLNWMKAQAMLVIELGVTFRSAKDFYKRVQRRNATEPQVNSICEQLLFSLNQIAALRGLATVPNKADVARVGIVTWYYGVYGAASAMIAAADGSFPETHASTALQWDRQFAEPKLALEPFADRIGNLTAAELEVALKNLRSRGKHSLTIAPTSLEQAWGCHAEYLSGTASWERWNLEQRVRGSPEFKALGVDNFRTKAARNLRDNAFAKKSIAFLHEASRYRGKANYRDAIYLAYGKSVPRLADNLIDDLLVVAIGFSAMAAAYCATRMGKERWTAFVDDLEARRAISVSPLEVWS
jgi:hypothetical protein